MNANERIGLFARLAAKRRAKHELPYTADEFSQMRRKAWRLVAQSQRAKQAGS